MANKQPDKPQNNQSFNIGGNVGGDVVGRDKTTTTSSKLPWWVKGIQWLFSWIK